MLTITCSRTNKSCAVFAEQKHAPLLLAADAGRYAPSPSQSIFTRLKQG